MQWYIYVFVLYYCQPSGNKTCLMAVVQLNLNQNKFEQMKDKPSANTVFMVANRVNVAVVATVVADNVTGIKCVFFHV